MKNSVPPIEEAIAALARLPGFGRKSASRSVYHLLQRPEAIAQLVASLDGLSSRVKRCERCGAYSETEICGICSDPSRDKSVLCVVEQSIDLMSIEGSGEFHGLYHVLHGVLSPLDGVGPEDLSIDALVARVTHGGFREIIFATNPTIEGDTTALYIRRMLRDHDLQYTRLALGLPVGGDLEYADRLSLARSLQGRIPLNG